ncbi:hypothetical protein [Endozoicomonas sp. ALB115]|uniref:hypothetical protein n=1 Tax=Endozoicomonas sp. ALB115 TaxID=3403074 RepID=UPI003BB74B42
MRVYKYDDETGEYLNPISLQKNPKHPNKYLVPPKNTLSAKPPKAINNQTVVVNASRTDWCLVPDFRGKEYYLHDGSFHKIENLGETPPEDALDEPPPPSLDILATQKLHSINTIANAILEPITSTYPKTEVVSWDKQEVEARRWQDWKTASSEAPEPPTQLIDNILATRTDITKPELVQRIIAKADSYAFSGQIFGIRHNLEKQLEAILADNTLTDDEKRTAIAAIDEQQAYSVVKR